MKTRECPSCAMVVDADLKICPVCGYEFTGSRTWMKLLALLLVLFFLYLIFF